MNIAVDPSQLILPSRAGIELKLRFQRALTAKNIILRIKYL
jgi:hypothetical protein